MTCVMISSVSFRSFLQIIDQLIPRAFREPFTYLMHAFFIEFASAGYATNGPREPIIIEIIREIATTLEETAVETSELDAVFTYSVLMARDLAIEPVALRNVILSVSLIALELESADLTLEFPVCEPHG